MKNARFWTFWNGSPVKLTLRPGDCLEIRRHTPTDEGWHFEAESYYYDPDDDGTVMLSTHTDGVDCDGLLSTSDEFCCPLSLLRSLEPADDGEILYPTWQRLRGRQRDYSAEAMGY